MLRKAASAADFRSFHPSPDDRGVNGGGGQHFLPLPDLGVLTPFYSVETGTFVADHEPPTSCGNGGVSGANGGSGGGGGFGYASTANKSSGALYAQQAGGGSGSQGNSLNASTGSLNTLRASASHAVLYQASAGGSHSGGALRHAHSGSGLSGLGSSSSSAALSSLVGNVTAGPNPHSSTTSASTAASSSYSSSHSSSSHRPHHLLTHFSLPLSGAPKSNGRPREERSELGMLTEKLREMQYEMSRLQRQIREKDQDAEQWTLRYGRRAVLGCQAMLALSALVLQFGFALRRRRTTDSWLHRVFIPAHVYGAQGGARQQAMAAASAQAAAAAAGRVGGAAKVAAMSAAMQRHTTPLSAVLISGCLSGLMSAAPFALAFALQLRGQAWPRNVASLISTAYSLALLCSSARRLPHARPPAAHALNILTNIFYVGARYYFLHGLLVYSSMRIL